MPVRRQPIVRVRPDPVMLFVGLANRVHVNHRRREGETEPKPRTSYRNPLS
jgi:hypothetical protein